VLTLVGRARRRLFGNELLSQGANAASAAVLALIFLLLLGTQILDWRWLLLVTVLAAGGGLYRARKRLPSRYAAAQIVDRRMALADTISTALYFSQNAAPVHSSPEIQQFQLQRANWVSESVDLRRAVPYTMPRSLYVLGALVLVAGSLFALRYGLSRRLDLKPPLASILQQQFGWNVGSDVARDVRRHGPQPRDPRDDSAASVTDPDQNSGAEPDPTANDTTDGSGEPAPENAASSKGAIKKDNDQGQKGANGDQDAQAESNDQSQNGDNSGQQSNNKQDSKQSGAKPDAGNAGESSGLMNKMKDLFQNLLSSVKPPQTNPSNQQQNSDPNNRQGKGQQNGGKQQQGKNGPQQNNGQPGDSQDGQQGEQAQSPQDPQGKGNGKSDSQQASKQPGSGIGNQDGDKSIKQAEDLAAMGKITEIIGKRTANITGEATVEVQNTSQQLHTPYAPRGAQHAQNGAAISRDEIPVAMQPYVQQYFEQVRKLAAPPPKKQ